MSIMIDEDTECLLPQTGEALDRFVADLIETFSLPPGDDTYDMVATAILHMDQSKAKAAPSYFANKIRKAIANRAAWVKIEEFRVKRETEKKNAELKLVPPEADSAGVEPLQNA